MSIYTIAEIGINHNGSLELARKLIDLADFAGFDAVKFQKRTIDLVHTPEQLNARRESPWGTTYREYREAVEFEQDEYEQIDRHCRARNLVWSASAWDAVSLEFLSQFDLPWNKVASAVLTDHELLYLIAQQKKPTFISTGMSTHEEIATAVNIFRSCGCPFTLMHCNSAYPADVGDLNLRVIPALKETFDAPVGYSGHEHSLAPTLAAIALGASAIERHITLDKTMYGTDQAASVNPVGCIKLIQYVRELEQALGDGIKRITEQERAVMHKLRRGRQRAMATI